MSETQIVSVDVRKLGLGMSHAFQGMAEVCASLGVPRDSMLGAVDEAEEQAQTSSIEQKDEEQAAKGRTMRSAAKPDGNIKPTENKGSSGSQEVKQNADQTVRSAVDVAVDADDVCPAGSNAADSDASVSEGDNENVTSAPVVTADDIIRVLSAKVQQKKIKAADARALLEKYGAKSVSSLDSKFYNVVLEEASSM